MAKPGPYTPTGSKWGTGRTWPSYHEYRKDRAVFGLGFRTLSEARAAREDRAITGERWQSYIRRRVKENPDWRLGGKRPDIRYNEWLAAYARSRNKSVTHYETVRDFTQLFLQAQRDGWDTSANGSFAHLLAETGLRDGDSSHPVGSTPRRKR